MNQLVFIFGLPGVGKSYVAEILRDDLGFTIHNGDEDLPEPMRQALYQKSEITNSMRTDFVQSMILRIRQLLSKHSRLAIHQTLLKSFMRDALAKEFPQATFLLVESETNIRETRYIDRKYFNLGIEYLRHMSKLFDPPTRAAIRLINSQDGKEEILKQLHTVFSPNSNH